MTPQSSTIVYLPHGGGPLPLLGDPRHAALVSFMRSLPAQWSRPDLIVMVSAHWETATVMVSGSAQPGMIFDYHGFPEASYQYHYDAPGEPGVAARLAAHLHTAGITAGVDEERGFDHGTFVPLMLMYPEADIPVVQVSLLESLDAHALTALGHALAGFDCGNALIVGSGMSFHNMAGFMSEDPSVHERSAAFDQWLNDVVTGGGRSATQREQQLLDWSAAPQARFCHPRAEHLLPLHVCSGAAAALELPGRNVFRDDLLGVQVSGFVWGPAADA